MDYPDYNHMTIANGMLWCDRCKKLTWHKAESPDGFLVRCTNVRKGKKCGRKKETDKVSAASSEHIENAVGK